MSWRTPLILLLGFGGVSLLAGCGPPTATVSGKVTVDGKPLEKGIISYVPADGAGAPATANVVNGEYEVRTFPGNKHVQISAPVVVGQRKEYNGPNAPLTDITEESIPERYNSKTELTLEVKAGGNTKDWSVEAKKHKP